MIKSDYPALANLLHCYLGQDYDVIDEDPEKVIEAYKQRELPGNVRMVIADLRRFLSANQSSPLALEKEFEQQFGSSASLEGWNGRTTREWLLRAIEILSDKAEVTTMVQAKAGS